MKYRTFALFLIISYAGFLFSEDFTGSNFTTSNSTLPTDATTDPNANPQPNKKKKKKKKPKTNPDGTPINQVSYNDAIYSVPAPHPYYQHPADEHYAYQVPHYNGPVNNYHYANSCCSTPPPAPCYCPPPSYCLPNYCEPSCAQNCGGWNFGPHILNGYLAHTEGKGLGYSIGYTTIGLFYMPQSWNNPDFRPFVDLRGHVFNNGKWAANAGVGLRYIVPYWDTVFGVNFYYDYLDRDSTDLNQVSFGLEALNPCFDLRLNAYFPVGNKTVWGHREEYPNGLFKLVRREQRWALSGFDAEIGTNLYQRRPWACADWFDLYGAIGPYYYSSHSGKNVVGGRARLVAELTQYVFVEGIATYDAVYHWGGQGRITLNIPLGPQNIYVPRCNSCCDSCILDVLAAQPVYRQEIITVGKNRNCYHWEANCD